MKEEETRTKRGLFKTKGGTNFTFKRALFRVLTINAARSPQNDAELSY